MTMTKHHQASLSIASALAGPGLFLATAAVAQWIRVRQQRQGPEESASGDEDRCAGAEERVGEQPSDGNTVSREAFRRRRLSMRLSFDRLANWGGSETGSPPVTNDRCHDFHHGSMNWRHFDALEEDNVPSARPAAGASQRREEECKLQNSRQHSIENGSDEGSIFGFCNGSEDDSDNLQKSNNFFVQGVGGHFRRSLSLSSSAIDPNSVDGGCGPEDSHRALRTEYNAQIMPEKVVLIRHGQSMGNVDETFYATTPDNAMPMTDLGWEQARHAGTVLKDQIIAAGESVHFIVSPYVRTVETFHGLASAWCDPDGEEFASIEDRDCRVHAWYERLRALGLTWNEDPRIREQDVRFTSLSGWFVFLGT